jgi:hypothetical protein
MLIEGFRDIGYVQAVHQICPELGSDFGTVHSRNLPQLQRLIFIGGQSPAGMLGWDDVLERGNTIPSEQLLARESELDFDDAINNMACVVSGPTMVVPSALRGGSYVEGSLGGALHRFETALDLTLCVPETADPRQTGFYLLMAMGSEHAGLTGFKGSIVRKVAVDRSASSLQKSLTVIKSALESDQ